MNETNIRKGDHIRICLQEDVQAHGVETGLNEVHLLHRALTGIAIEDVDPSTEVLGHQLSAPIIIEAMTGGVERAYDINAALAEAAEGMGLAMGVGSQRAAIEDAGMAYTFEVVREKAPHAFLIANIGVSQMGDYSLEEVEKAVDMIQADALALHFNPLQEAVQPEGSPRYAGLLHRIEELASCLSIPLIAKETGAGFSREDAKVLEAVGMDGIDVAGAGGTSWSAVESFRAKAVNNGLRTGLGETFRDWGIPTAVSVVEVSESVDLEVIASGGLRSGVDVAKTLALGADAAGFALPLLKPALEGRVEETLEGLIQELKTAMFLVGAQSIEDLKGSAAVIVGKTSQWLRMRGFKPEQFARRRRS